MSLGCLATSKWNLQKVGVYIGLELIKEVWAGSTDFDTSTMVVKIRQVAELTKGSRDKLLQEETIKGIFALKR